ncbi:hypothetical protein NIES4102_12160 [Chondrocystis sp. NIES-4102]|nr:hypothetical protein NIES4102_12160 [Chondrocystis sp. NIES-4102]
MTTSTIYPKLVNSNENKGAAENIFKNAYNNRYTWNQDFPGYTAKVVATYEGKEDIGNVVVTPTLEIKVENIEDPMILDLINNQLMMEINHRQNIPFKQLHESSQFIVKEIDSGVANIEKQGEELASYKVQNDKIIQVNRLMKNNVSVTVDTLKTIDTPSGYLASEYLSTIKDAQKNQLIQEVYSIDEHQKVGGFYILNSRKLYFSKDPDRNAEPEINIEFKDISLQ